MADKLSAEILSLPMYLPWGTAAAERVVADLRRSLAELVQQAGRPASLRCFFRRGFHNAGCDGRLVT